MNTFQDYGDDKAIMEWADEQQHRAAAITEGDSLRNAKLIIDYAENLKALVRERPRSSLPDIENARRKLLAQMSGQSDKAGTPLSKDQLKAFAEKQAYREARPEIVELVAEIEAMRAQTFEEDHPA